MRYIQRKLHQLDSGEELDSGQQILNLFVMSKVAAYGDMAGQPAGSDFEQQRSTYKALRYLRGGAKGKDIECAIPMGDYVALEDAWYEHLMHQARHWRWGANDPGIFEMIEAWESAPDREPVNECSLSLLAHTERREKAEAR